MQNVGEGEFDFLRCHHSVHALRPRQDGRHFPDDILKDIFNENFDYNFPEVCSNWQLVNICSDNGLAPSRRQAIIWNNAAIVHRCMYASRGLNELTPSLQKHCSMCLTERQSDSILLNHLCWVFVSKPDHHCMRLWFVACCIIRTNAEWTRRISFTKILFEIQNILIYQIPLENFVCTIAANFFSVSMI